MDTSIEPSPPAALPASEPVARVVLKPRKARPFFGRHPWVLDSAVDRVDGPAADGDVVDLFTDQGKFIARGVYNSQSRIRVRLYTWKAGEALDESFWRARLQAAAGLRAQHGFDDRSQAARLVSSEGDRLSGLVVERYADQLVVQVTAKSMAVRLPLLIPMLQELWQPRGITLRTEREMNKAEGLSLKEGTLVGEVPEGPVFFTEHGVRYGVDLQAGQKTGFFLDQRDNRRAAASYARDRRVLDVCCYTGGFSIAAAAIGGAHEVLGIDSSAKAIAVARAHAELNSQTRVQFEEADAFQKLENLYQQRELFGLVIVDPPKFARTRQHVEEAMRAYHQLNRLAVSVLEPGGILVTCSCSGHVTREDFMFTLAEVSERTGRDIQILETRGAAADHPVNASCLESEYLKCLVCRVG